MPDVFNFTARATAASGAFADRDFSITVNNTQINRLLAVGQSGAARSLNSHTPWVAIPGVKGDSAAYGDRWLIWDQAAGVLWTSPDAINFTSFVPTLPSGYSRLGFLRWRSGAWWAMAVADRTSHWDNGVVTSIDGGLTWSLVGAPFSDGAFGYSFERSEAGASIIATTTQWLYRPNDGAAWTVARGSNYQSQRFQIAHLNGIWFGPDSAGNNGLLARSLDGQAWFAQSNPTVLISGGYYRGVAWGNGYTIASALLEGVASFTTDAGLTVQAAGAALPGYLSVTDTECPIVCVQGRFVMLGDAGATYAAATPAGPWAATALPAGLFPATLAVRP